MVGFTYRTSLTGRVADWPYSTFHRDVRRRVVTADWGGGEEVHAAGERQG